MNLLMLFTLCLCAILTLGNCGIFQVSKNVQIRHGIASLTWYSEKQEKKVFTIFQAGSGTAALALEFNRTTSSDLLTTTGNLEFWEGGTVYAEFVRLNGFGFVHLKTWRMVLMDIESIRDDSALALERARVALALVSKTPTLVLSAMNKTLETTVQSMPSTMSARLCPYIAVFKLDPRTTSVLNGSFDSVQCHTKLNMKYSPFPLIRTHYRVTFGMFMEDLRTQLEDFITSNSTLIFLYFFQFIMTLRQVRSSRKAPSAINPLFLALLVVSTVTQDLLRRKVFTIGSRSDIGVIGVIVGCASAYMGWLIECINLRRAGGPSGGVGAIRQTRSGKIMETTLWILFIVFGITIWLILPLRTSNIYHLIVSVCFFLGQLIFGRTGFLHCSFIIITCTTCLIGLIFTQADENAPYYQLHLILTFLSSICIVSQAIALILERKRAHRRDYNEIRSGQDLNE